LPRAAVEPDTGSARRPRPAAPQFSFGPVPDDAPPIAPRAPRPPDVAVCGVCQSPNPPEYRFCVTCGGALGGRPAPAAAGPPPLPPQPTSDAAQSVGEPIIGAPVLDIAAASSVPARMITCGRCHGHCMAGTRFCKYCGAVLEDARSPSAPAVAPPEASTPPRASSPPHAEPSRSADPVAVERSAPRPAVVPSPVAASAPAPNGATRLVPLAQTPDGPLSVPRPVAFAPVDLRPAEPIGQPAVAVAQPAPARDDVRVPVPSLGPAPIVPMPPTPSAAASPKPEAWAPPPKHDLGVRLLPDMGQAPAPTPPEASASPGAPAQGSPTHPATNYQRHADDARPPAREGASVDAPTPPRPAARDNGNAQPWALARSAAPPEGAAGPNPPAAEARASGRLVVIVEDGSEGRSFSLTTGQLDVGRTEGNIVLEDDPYVSPRHARIQRTGASWTVRDLGSTNGVYLRLRKQHPLVDGDLLLLGLEVLQFQTVNDGERGLGHAIQHGTFVFGSPAARGSMARARLCQRTVEGVTRDVYHLFRDETVIGREVGDIVFTADPFLSRRHAAVVRNPVSSEFGLVDLDSSNGTYVAIRGEVAIGDGDYLRIGQHLFRVDLG
jgi:pSer/pThr/pTyr-binding forkhead associated (FHA) protein